MSDVPKPKADDRKSRLPNEADEAAIVNPINIARARHAVAHNQSVAEQQSTKAAKTPTGKKVNKPAVSHSGAARSATAKQVGSSFGAGSQPAFTNFVEGRSGCMLFSMLGITFLLGGVLGGLIGGGLLLGLAKSNGVALLQEPTPTPTRFVTPTPAPVETLTPTPTIEPSPTPAIEDIIAGIIPSVVTVINKQNNGINLDPEDSRVVGTGVVIDARGYIATNHHVIENPGALRIILSDGRDLAAEFIVSDPAEDLALLKVSADNLLPIKWGDSITVRPGQTVYAIGSPLGDFPNSVSLGVVSGLNRALEMETFVIDSLIQTDAAINRGSSGGPLINAHGEMIGINTFIIRESENRGVAEGIAFAVPTNIAKNLLLPWIVAHGGDSVPIPAAEEPDSN